MSTPFETTLNKTIAAPREKVYDAWLDPAALAKFMCPGPEVTVGRVENDPVVGGNFEIVMIAGDTELPHTGEYQRLERPSRLTFSWRSKMADDSVVDITLEPADGGTELTLTHTGLPSEESAKGHNGGWAEILDKLEKTVA